MDPVEKPVPADWLAAVERLMQVVDTLRSPGGCPWDAKQTVETLTPHLVEESHELADAVARGDADGTREELGDLQDDLPIGLRDSSPSDLLSSPESK